MADANGIPYEPSECNHEGECSGTCPHCEKEAADLLAEIKETTHQEVRAPEENKQSRWLRFIGEWTTGLMGDPEDEED